MRRVVRPAIAVLLLVGVGMAAAKHAAARCGGPTCALIDAEEDDVRVGDLPVALAESPRLARPDEQPPLTTVAPAPLPAPRTGDLLSDAPKTSPPA